MVRKKSFTQILKYSAAGGLAFFVEYLLFIVILSNSPTSDISLGMAQTISFCGGLLTSFTGNRLFTFKSGEARYTHTRTGQAVRYLLLAITNLLISNTVLHVLVFLLGVDPNIAKVVVMTLVALWNFILFKKVIFKTNEKLR